MTNRRHIIPAFASAPLAIILWTANSTGFADYDDEIPFDEAELFFELNDTDGDLGIHAKIDGEAWKKLSIEDQDGRQILKVRAKRRLAKQGMTELFFESAEPPFNELDPADFFRRFPAGMYEIEGETLNGKELESEVELTHVMPAPAQVKVNGVDAAVDCDAELPLVDPKKPVTISWDQVTTSHPEVGISQEQIMVVNYEVVIEIDDTPYKASTILPPEADSFVVPAELLTLSDEIKFEVLVREVSYNQTAVESCFEIADPIE